MKTMCVCVGVCVHLDFNCLDHWSRLMTKRENVICSDFCKAIKSFVKSKAKCWRSSSLVTAK